MTLANRLRDALPQPLRRAIKYRFYQRFKKSILWEYMPDGWETEKRDQDIKGWNVQSVLDTYIAGWPIFVAHLGSTHPLGFWYEVHDRMNTNLIPHNIHMSYAYALALASRSQDRISMLDWGGAIGQYYKLSRTLFPDLEIEYHCKEVSLLAEHGRSLFPEAHFHSDESCLGRTYDFVLASSSIHYTKDWATLVRRLAGATGKYLYITRIPIVEHAESFVFVQRPYTTGYNTEYLGWCLNRGELLRVAQDAGLSLVREFVMGENPEIERAPEQNMYRGFLFRAAPREIGGQ